MLTWFGSLWDARAVIALVALVQPWVYWLYRKYAKGGAIDIHHTGTVEVGFSGLGATIALQGTVRAVDRDFFISSMSLEVVRERDRARHMFEWGAFRPPAVLVGESKDPIEMPAGFMLQPLAPRRYNIVFIDQKTGAEVRQLVDPVTSAWLAAIRQDKVAEDARRNYYETQFSQQPIHVNVWADLDRVMYWQPGNYELELLIRTTRPTRDFRQRWTFELTADDVRDLRNNRLVMLNAIGGLSGRLHFAYRPYL